MTQSRYYFKRGDSWYHSGDRIPHIDDYAQASHIIDFRLGVIIENANSSDNLVNVYRIQDAMTEAELTAIILSALGE